MFHIDVDAEKMRGHSLAIPRSGIWNPRYICLLSLGGGDRSYQEHTLEHWDLFQEYLKLYESTLATWLNENGVSQSEFYNDVRYVQNSNTDPKVQEFIYCLLASCDYDSFYSVMVREAMKLGTRPRDMPVMAESKVRASA